MKIKPKKITLKDIAEIAGVSSAAVSGVLNNSPRIKCGKSKRDLILNLAKTHNYAPNSSARALAVGRTGQIGFLVAEVATLGLGNSYFAQQLSGVEKVVTENGYLTTVSACDLSDISKFIFPDKLKRKSVDGLVVSGPILPEVIDIIRDIGTPAVICYDPGDGNSDEFMRLSDNQFFLSYNNKHKTLQAINYLHELGHRKICLSSLWEGMLAKIPKGIRLIHEPLNQSCTFKQGVLLGQKWLSQSPNERFTGLLGSDQFCYGFIRSLNLAAPGLCPSQVSVICQADTKMNEYTYPSLTSFSCNPYLYGRKSAELLIDLLEGKRLMGELVRDAKNFYDKNLEIITRESTGTTTNISSKKLK